MSYSPSLYMNHAQLVEYMSWALDHINEGYALTGKNLVEYPYKLRENSYVADLPEIVDWFLKEYCHFPFIQDYVAKKYKDTDSGPENEILNMVIELKLAFGNTALDFALRLSQADNLKVAINYLQRENEYYHNSTKDLLAKSK